MSKRPRIGIDLDGVAVQWVEHACQLLSERLGREFPIPRQWAGCGADWDISEKDWNWLWKHPDLWYKAEIYPGTITALRELGKMADIVIITSRPVDAIDDTHDWINHKNLTWFIDEINILWKGQCKTTVPCDLYVDDYSLVANSVVDKTSAEVAMWRRPWNEAYNRQHPRITYVDSWKEVELLAKSIGEGLCRNAPAVGM